MVGVTGSIPVAPTTQHIGIKPRIPIRDFARKLRAFLYPLVSLLPSLDDKFTSKAALSLDRKIPFLGEL